MGIDDDRRTVSPSLSIGLEEVEEHGRQSAVVVGYSSLISCIRGDGALHSNGCSIGRALDW
jgi:hypothetical protein